VAMPKTHTAKRGKPKETPPHLTRRNTTKR
jgi:hypothetical protein